ncbi:MAG: CinA family protein [Hyphomicrobium sp.]
MFDHHLTGRAEKLLQAMRERGMTIATAESCTGGLIAALLTEIPGSSDVVERGFVTYSNQAKMDMLGVPATTLASVGAVSRQTALAMAAGALAASRATISVAVTGVAGPSGGTAEKPVGLVHLCVQRQGRAPRHHEARYGDLGRAGVRMATVATALDMLFDELATT